MYIRSSPEEQARPSGTTKYDATFTTLTDRTLVTRTSNEERGAAELHSSKYPTNYCMVSNDVELVHAATEKLKQSGQR